MKRLSTLLIALLVLAVAAPSLFAREDMDEYRRPSDNADPQIVDPLILPGQGGWATMAYEDVTPYDTRVLIMYDNNEQPIMISPQISHDLTHREMKRDRKPINHPFDWSHKVSKAKRDRLIK